MNHLFFIGVISFLFLHPSTCFLSLPHPSGERVFPPASGLTYSTWFCVERFSSAPHLHPLRLLTVVRRASASEQHYVCLSITLSPSDRSLSVSTKEELLHSYCESGVSECCVFILWRCVCVCVCVRMYFCVCVFSHSQLLVFFFSHNRYPALKLHF